MKSGFLPKTDRQARDELIAGTDRDPANVRGGAAGRRAGRSRPSERGAPAAAPRRRTVGRRP